MKEKPRYSKNQTVVSYEKKKYTIKECDSCDGCAFERDSAFCFVSKCCDDERRDRNNIIWVLIEDVVKEPKVKRKVKVLDKRSDFEKSIVEMLLG